MNEELLIALPFCFSFWPLCFLSLKFWLKPSKASFYSVAATSFFLFPLFSMEYVYLGMYVIVHSLLRENGEWRMLSDVEVEVFFLIV